MLDSIIKIMTIPLFLIIASSALSSGKSFFFGYQHEVMAQTSGSNICDTNPDNVYCNAIQSDQPLQPDQPSQSGQPSTNSCNGDAICEQLSKLVHACDTGCSAKDQALVNQDIAALQRIRGEANSLYGEIINNIGR